MSEHCPMCGGSVKVVCNDKDLGKMVTNHYEPVMPPEVERLAEVARRVIAKLSNGVQYAENLTPAQANSIGALEAALKAVEEEYHA